MKKLLLTALMFVCLSGLVKADGEYIDSTHTIVDQVRINLNLSHTNTLATDSVILGYVYEGAIITNAITRGRLIFDTVTTTAYDFMKTYDTLLEIVDNVIMFSRDSLHQLIWADKSVWDDLDANDVYLSTTTDWPDRLPTHYDWDKGYLFLYPVPGHTGDSILVAGYAKPDDMISDPKFVRDIEVIHRPAIVYYATSMLALRLGIAAESQAWDLKYSNYVNSLNSALRKTPEVVSE